MAHGALRRLLIVLWARWKANRVSAVVPPRMRGASSSRWLLVESPASALRGQPWSEADWSARRLRASRRISTRPQPTLRRLNPAFVTYGTTPLETVERY